MGCRFQRPSRRRPLRNNDAALAIATIRARKSQISDKERKEKKQNGPPPETNAPEAAPRSHCSPWARSLAQPLPSEARPTTSAETNGSLTSHFEPAAEAKAGSGRKAGASSLNGGEALRDKAAAEVADRDREADQLRRAREAAWRRWDTDLRSCGTDTYTAVIAAMDMPLMERITEAELDTPGSGVDVALATGPPLFKLAEPSRTTAAIPAGGSIPEPPESDAPEDDEDDEP